jgi:hypothetical protein
LKIKKGKTLPAGDVLPLVGKLVVFRSKILTPAQHGCKFLQKILSQEARKEFLSH